VVTLDVTGTFSEIHIKNFLFQILTFLFWKTMYKFPFLENNDTFLLGLCALIQSRDFQRNFPDHTQFPVPWNLFPKMVITYLIWKCGKIIHGFGLFTDTMVLDCGT